MPTIISCLSWKTKIKFGIGHLAQANRATVIWESYGDFYTPQLSSHFAVHLQSNLGGYSHKGLRFADGARHHTLAGSGAVHTQVLFHTVILVLSIGRQDHNHLWKAQKQFETIAVWIFKLCMNVIASLTICVSRATFCCRALRRDSWRSSYSILLEQEMLINKKIEWKVLDIQNFTQLTWWPSACGFPWAQPLCWEFEAEIGQLLHSGVCRTSASCPDSCSLSEGDLSSL